MAPKKLVVLINDRLSEIIKKGELIDRYYNPGNLFDEVHIFVFYEDREKLDKAALKKLVGKANVFVHQNLVKKSWFFLSLGWRPFLLQFFFKSFLNKVRRIRPNLIRCHDCKINGFAGFLAWRVLGIPYVVSLHTTPDEAVSGVESPIKNRILRYFEHSFEKKVLRNAMKVMPVYQAILPFLECKKVNNIELIYNVINPIRIRGKKSYLLHNPIKILSVGRQINGKNPENIIRAIKGVDNATLTLIGDGPLHGSLKRIAIEAGVSDRVIFISSMQNDVLCESLPDFDIFVAHSEYLEISKSVLEPLLTGLPVIINKRIGRQIPEFDEKFMLLTDNSVRGYQMAISSLLLDNALREKIGIAGYEHANHLWSPLQMEMNYKNLYQKIMVSNFSNSKNP